MTGAPDDLSLELLRRASWNLEAAVDGFFASGFSTKASRGRPPVDTAALEALFDHYKGGKLLQLCLYALSAHVLSDADAGCILAEGVQQFCEDLEVDPMDIVMVRALVPFLWVMAMHAFRRW